MTLEGNFPGSPDHDYFVVDAKTYDKVRDLVFPFGLHDTLADALKGCPLPNSKREGDS